MQENNSLTTEETTEEVKEFQTLNTNEIEKETKSVDLNKTTTKGLRITEKTKLRYNQAEKASGLSQEEFTNRLLDMCDFFEGSDLSKNPELIELSSIVNRIPEIFMGLISKQKTYENGLVTRHTKELDELKSNNEEISHKYNELKEKSKEEFDKLNGEFEKLKAQSELKIREQESEIEKTQKENKEKDEQLKTLKKNLELTKESLDSIKSEQFKKLEKINEKTDEINMLKEKLQEAQNNLLAIKQEKLEIESTIIEHQKQADYYKMQLENSELKLTQQKEMYEERIAHYKSIIK